MNLHEYMQKGTEFLPQTQIFSYLYLQTEDENLWYFNRINSSKYQRSTTLDCKNIGMDKFEFVAKIHFLYRKKFSICHKFWSSNPFNSKPNLKPI